MYCMNLSFDVYIYIHISLSVFLCTYTYVYTNAYVDPDCIYRCSNLPCRHGTNRGCNNLSASWHWDPEKAASYQAMAEAMAAMAEAMAGAMAIGKAGIPGLLEASTCCTHRNC